MFAVMRVGVVTALLGVGCVSSEQGFSVDAVSVLQDRSEPTSRRMRAVETMPLNGPGRDTRLAALHVVVWSDRHPVALRMAVIDRLRADDVEMFWRAAERWLMHVDQPVVLAGLADRAVLDGRIEMLPVWVRRWGRPTAEPNEKHRPEHQAVAALGGDGNAAATLERLIGSPDLKAAFAGWAVLMRWRGETALREWVLAQDSTDSQLIADLQAAAQTLSRLPSDGEGLAWLIALRRNTQGWKRWEWVRFALSDVAAAGLELRHIPAICNADRMMLGMSLESLRRAWASPRVSAHSIPREIEPAAARPVDLSSESLCWGDVVVGLMVCQAMQTPAVVRAWFVQADADREDPTTEYGGVLTWDKHRQLVAHAFTPERKEGDQKFFTPSALVTAMYTGLAHYHFHAQSHSNAEYAGPGRGDLAFAEALRANTLVLTFIDRDTLNVDLVLPGGLVVDLGCISRPADAE